MAADEYRAVEPIDILLVEPNPGDTRLFSEQFKEAKIVNTIHAVTDGETALDYIHGRGDYEHAECPDIVLLEPNLPGVGGEEVVTRLANEPPANDVPVVALTSSAAGEEILRSRGLDADAYVQKPIEPKDFVEFVQSIEDLWLAIVQAPDQE